MVLNLIDHERVAPLQVNGFADPWIVCAVRWVHGFVNCIMQDDAERIRHMGEKTQPRDTDSVRFGISQQVHGDRARWKGKAKVALDYGDDVVLREFGSELHYALLD